MKFHYNEQVEEPTQRVMRYGFPLNVIGMLLPEYFRKPFSRQVYNMRVVELPFLYNNIPVPAKNGEKVLDFGCCESRNALHLASVGYQVTGIDYQSCYPFHHKNIVSVKGDMLNATGQSYGKPLPCYDYIIAISSIEHSGLPAYGNVKRDLNAPRKIIEIFHRIIKPSGKLILTVPYGDEFKTTDFERTYTKVELEKLLSGKFGIEKFETYGQNENGSWQVACIVAGAMVQ